jgi:glycerate kinase
VKILLAPDSFKESLPAPEVCAVLERGLKKALPDSILTKIPMADGGEGSLQCLLATEGIQLLETRVENPLGEITPSFFGISNDGKTGFVEMAMASGLALVPNENRDILKSSSFGTGQLIRSLLDYPVEKILVFLGGSATNDGGAGLLQALGFRFLDKEGNDLPRGGGSLNQLVSIEKEGADSGLKNVQFFAAADVRNPLCGPTGASFVYGPQKGGTPETIELLDQNLRNYGRILEKEFGRKILNEPGSGAAGGTAAGLMAALQATLVSGFETVAKFVGLEEKIQESDLVITGEGSLDAQTREGKVVSGISRLAAKHGKPVVALVGKSEPGLRPEELGLKAIVCINPESEKDPLKNAAQNLERTAAELGPLIRRILG